MSICFLDFGREGVIPASARHCFRSSMITLARNESSLAMAFVRFARTPSMSDLINDSASTLVRRSSAAEIFKADRIAEKD